MAINRRLEKLEEAENDRLNAEFRRLVGLLRTAFSEDEKLEIIRANNFDLQPMTNEERETPIREFLTDTDLALKRRVVEGLQRLLEKWQSSLRQRAVTPNWDASSLIDEEIKRRNDEDKPRWTGLCFNEDV